MTEPLTHPSFKHLTSRPIDLLNLTIHEFKHIKTGAMHYHFSRDSDENVFLVGFRTAPQDSTGVAHILEHTSLCGSDKYPVRDPFFMMLRRSLNTFMNAFTSSDWTAYPFASTNHKDFNNLLEVYLDAVFFTRLDERDFKQEGHRLDFAVEGDTQSDLVYKGVVYNEMKGAMSATDSQLWHGLCEHLYETTTYHYNSGGDPKDIVTLSHDALRDFHAQHYHPSNAIFMTYGNILPDAHQAKIDAFALNKFNDTKQPITIPLEKRFQKHKTVVTQYPVQASDSTRNKSYHIMAWLLDPITDFEKKLEAHFLNGVLLGDSAAPLLAALESTDLGSSPSSLCGLDDSSLQMSFLCGIEGSSPNKAKAFETLVLDVLQDIAENGVPKERLETVLHQLELSQRKMSSSPYPYGLSLMLGALPCAVHRGNVLEALDIDPVLAQLRQSIKDPDYIKQLVKRFLIDNPHRLTFTMAPDKTLNAKHDKQLKASLAALKQAMSDDEKAAIIRMAKALKARQTAEEDPSILPKVSLSDVPDTINIPTPTSHQPMPKHKRHTITAFETATNGITYQDIIMPIPALDPELLPFLPIYTTCLTEVGCGQRDYKAMNAWQSKVSGGVSIQTTFKTSIHNAQQYQADFICCASALIKNQPLMSDLVQEMLDHARFDEYERLKNLVSQLKSAWNDDIVGSGHSYAMATASSGMSPVSQLAYQLTGMQGIANLNAFVPSLERKKGCHELANKLQAIHHAVKQASKSFLLIDEAKTLPHSIDQVNTCWQDSALLGTQTNHIALPDIRQQTNELWICNTQVNFCAKAYPTVPFGHDDYAKLLVLSGFLRNGFLHPAIREQGGAYGAGANQNRTSASFQFFSYRDPRDLETLHDFDRSIDWLMQTQHAYRPLEEAILGVISALDKPGTPVSEARAAFYDQHYGVSPDIFQRLRQQVLAVTVDDLQQLAERYFQRDQASTAIITNEEGAKKAFASLDLTVNWLDKPS